MLCVSRHWAWQIEEYGELVPENNGKAEGQGNPELQSGDVSTSVHPNKAGNSRSHDEKKDKEKAHLFTSVLRDLFRNFGGDDDGQEEHTVQNKINQEDNVCKSLEDKRERVKELRVTNIKPNEDLNTRGKGKAVAPSVVFEIPSRPPVAQPNQMATFNVSNIIGIQTKPYDRSTYVEDDFYVTDMSGSRRRIPPANIIRWKKIMNPDGTTSVVSNARFVKWLDGSVQLFIGNEGFNVYEQDVKDMHSHLFLRHKEGIFEAQGQISRKLKFMPTSLASNSHRNLTAQVNAQNEKVIKVRHYITDVDPEWEMEQKVKAEKLKSKATKKSEKSKKVARNNSPKVRGVRGLAIGFLKDPINEEQNDTHLQAVCRAISTQNLSESEKVEFEYELKGTEDECSQSYRGVEEAQKGEAEEAYEDSEVGSEKHFHEWPEEARSEAPKRTAKKRYIESDEDSPPRKPTRKRVIMYDSNEE